MNFTIEQYQTLTNSTFISKYAIWLNKYAQEFKVNTPSRILCFLANLIVETGNFKWIEELTSGSQYEGRIDLGNNQKGDGVKFKGRGLGMVTGRYNHQMFTNWCATIGITINFVKTPELLEEPQYAVLSAFWFWKANNLQKFADNNQFQQICAVWNTGKFDRPVTKINGWTQRVNAYNNLQKKLTLILNS